MIADCVFVDNGIATSSEVGTKEGEENQRDEKQTGHLHSDCRSVEKETYAGRCNYAYTSPKEMRRAEDNREAQELGMIASRRLHLKKVGEKGEK